MRGKYSPTIQTAYMRNQQWFNQYANKESPDFGQYDPEGYDSYGYNKDDIDRAGNEEHVYYPDDDEFGNNWAYHNALVDWGFDGTKPVKVDK